MNAETCGTLVEKWQNTRNKPICTRAQYLFVRYGSNSLSSPVQLLFGSLEKNARVREISGLNRVSRVVRTSGDRRVNDRGHGVCRASRQYPKRRGTDDGGGYLYTYIISRISTSKGCYRSGAGRVFLPAGLVGAVGKRRGEGY